MPSKDDCNRALNKLIECKQEDYVINVILKLDALCQMINLL